MKNTALMKACGSESGRYDPESPEQTIWVLMNGEGPEKALAWIKTKTVFMSRSPYCADEHGRALYIDSMASENRWTLKTAQNYCYLLNKQGRIRLEGKRIYYRADVPLASVTVSGEDPEPEESEELTGEDDGRTKGEQFDFAQSQVPTYVVEFIENLPAEKQRSARSTIQALADWKRRFFAEGEAQLRSIAEQIEDNTYRQIGVPKKRLPKRRAPNSEVVQLSLKLEPEFVQSQNGNGTGESVQSEKASLYKPKNGSVQTVSRAASLFTSDTDTDKSGGRAGVGSSKPASPPPKKSTNGTKPEPDPLEIGLAMRGYSHADVDLIRANLGQATADDFFGVLDDRLERAGRNHERIGKALLLELAKDAAKARDRIERVRTAGSV